MNSCNGVHEKEMHKQEAGVKELQRSLLPDLYMPAPWGRSGGLPSGLTRGLGHHVKHRRRDGSLSTEQIHQLLSR